MSDIIITIRGGVFQGAVSNTPGNRLMVIDFDDENDGQMQRKFLAVDHDSVSFTHLASEDRVQESRKAIPCRSFCKSA
jgi:hypothetical protein